VKKLVFILFVIFTATSFSIGNYDLFKKYLPKNVYLDVENGKSIKDNLDYYAGLNSDLIYCYINYLDLKINKKIDRKEDNGYNILHDMANKSLLQREKWLMSRIQAFDNIPESETIIWNINNFYRNFIVDWAELISVTGKTGSPDTNKMNYFSYIYFLNDSSQEYDENKNYYALVKQLIPAKIEDINKRILNLSDLSGEAKTSELKYLLGFWYLMGDASYNKYSLSNKMENFEVIYNNIPTISSLRWQIAVGAGYSPFMNKYNKTVTTEFSQKEFPEVSPYVSNTIPANTEAKAMISMGMGFDIPIRKELVSFSHLKVRFSYGEMIVKMSQPKYKQSLYSYYFFNPSDSTNNTIRYTADSAVGLKEYFIGLQVTTPLIYLSRAFSIEAGVYYSHYKFNIDMLIGKTYQISKPGKWYKEAKKEITKNKHFEETRISPVINFRYKLFKHLDVYLNTVWFQKAVVTPSIGLEGIITL
jgi:hypothetical protein